MNENELLLAIRAIMKEEIKSEIQPINEKLDILQNQVKNTDEKLESLQTQVQENTQILRALREHSEVNKAEHDTMQVDIAYIKGDLVGLKRGMATVEMATASNWQDIAALKLVK